MALICRRRLVVIVGLVKEEVGGQLLVLVAGKVGLDGLLAVEAKPTQLQNYLSVTLHRQQVKGDTYTLDGIALLLGHGDGLGTRR